MIDFNTILNYNADTGILEWKTKYQGIRKDSLQAGTKHSRGYISISHKGKKYLAHRVAICIAYGVSYNDNFIVDHLNGDRTDNRLSNLRMVNHRANHQNLGRRHDNTSGTTGVSFIKALDKWRARITVDYKEKHIGTYNTKDEAIQARIDAEKKLGYITHLRS